MLKMVMLATALSCSGIALAQAATLSAKEAAVLQQDARGSAYELALAKMAVQKSSNVQVRQFAQTDIQDHDTLLKQAQAIASADGVTLATTPDPQDADKLAELNKQSGRGFDDAFVKAMKALNQEDTRSSAADADRVSDRQLAGYMKKSAAVDKKHAELLSALQVAY